MKLIKKLIGLILIAALGISLAIGYTGYCMYKEAVTAQSIEDKVAEIRAIDNFTYFDELPENYINAVVAVEDRRFWNHHGFDIISTGRAIKRNLQDKGLTEGGSTITQQLAKNMYFTQEKKFSRKIAEIFVAIQLEMMYNKKDILELYVNDIYYGYGYYKLHDASLGYFNKAVSEMDDYECTMIAGVPNAPSVYSPKENAELAEQRRQQVIRAMIDCGYIEEGDIE